MENLYFAGIIIMIAALIYSKMVVNKGMQQLNNEQRGSLYNVFSKNSKFSAIFLIFILILFFALFKLNILSTMVLAIVYFVVLIGFLLYLMSARVKGLKSVGFSEEFIATYKKSEYIKMIGLLFFLTIIVFQFKAS